MLAPNTSVLVYLAHPIDMSYKSCNMTHLIQLLLFGLPLTVKSKARLVKEGTLTMTVYGNDERLVWQKRIAQFCGAVRRVLQFRVVRAELMSAP